LYLIPNSSVVEDQGTQEEEGAEEQGVAQNAE
jgi:hypothetical protein